MKRTEAFGASGGTFRSPVKAKVKPASVLASPSKTPQKISPVKRSVPEESLDPENMSSIEVTDHLLMLTNRNRKMLLQYHPEILPHLLQRIMKQSEVTVEGANARLQAVLNSGNVLFVGEQNEVTVEDNADKLANFEATAERLMEIAQKLDRKLSVEIVS